MPPATHVQDPDGLDFLRPWREPVSKRRILTNSAGSMLAHVLLIAFVLSLPDVERLPVDQVITPDFQKAVHLVAPRFYEPTQKAPNHGKVSRELDVDSMNQTPRRQSPKLRAPSPPPGPLAQAPIPVPAPKIEAPRIESPKIQIAEVVPVPTATAPPQPPPAQPPQAAPPKPKLAFESVTATPLQDTVAGNAKLHPASTSIEDSLRDARPGGGGSMVGDMGDSSTHVPSVDQPGSIGKVGSNLQLLSDAKGVDFKPYLVQVLTAVRRNWLAIIPESARLGRRGRVLIQFAIDRSGAIPKLVIAEGTGTDALDRAAVAAVSASYPFPPLPLEYKGDQIRLQLAFGYNMPAAK